LPKVRFRPIWFSKSESKFVKASRWSRDGKHIFYIARDKKLMEADFDPKTGAAGPPHALFQTRIVAPNYVGTQYDVAPDGRFLVNSLPADRAAPLTLLSNRTAALTQK
jgi:hypothetical protein